MKFLTANFILFSTWLLMNTNIQIIAMQIKLILNSFLFMGQVSNTQHYGIKETLSY